MELRKGSETVRLTVDTPRWHFIWDPARNRVMATPSRLEAPRQQEWTESRASVLDWSELFVGVPALEKDRFNGKEVDKVTIYYPADPEGRGRWPIHQFDPEVQRTVQSTEVRTRTYWFDPQTHRMVKRQCGCDPAKYEVKVDYPPPGSMSRGLFSFQIPSNAHLEVADPELGRPLESEGQTGD